MSSFGETLKTLISFDENGISQTQLAERTGISQATISRLLAGREPTRKQLVLLCAAISTDRQRRLELLMADLRDRAEAAKAAGIDERHYVLAPAPENSDEAVHVSGSLAADLRILADECARHEDVREMVSDWVNVIARHRAETADNRIAAGKISSTGGTTDPFGATVDTEGLRRSHSKRLKNSS